MNQLTEDEKLKLIALKYSILTRLIKLNNDMADLIVEKHNLKNQLRVVQTTLDGKP